MPQRDQPTQDYFVGCRVRLIVRLEEWGAGDAPKPPEKPPQLRKGQDEKPLEWRREDGRIVLAQKGSSSAKGASPQRQVSSPDDRTFEIQGVVPRSCSVKRNGVREADTATVELSLADFPLDPRVIRSCAVEVYMGTVAAGDYALGVLGEKRGDRSPGADDAGASLLAVGDTYLGPGGVQRSNLRFSGWVDEWSSEFDEDGEPTASLECIDNVKLLADQDAPPKLHLNPKAPLDESIAEYLSNFPQMAGLSVELRPAGTAPKLADALARTAFKPDLGPSKDGSSKTSVLDYVSDVASSLGFLVRVEGTSVVVQLPRTLYAGGARRADDPFTGRILPSGRTLVNRTLYWGGNLLRMGFKKKFGRSVSTNLEVRSYSARQKKTLVVRHPPKDKQLGKPSPGGNADATWKVVVVAGIEDEKTLRQIAQGAYEMSNRHELSARVETQNLGSLGGGNSDPDLLDVEAGDPVDVEVSPGDFADDSTGEGEASEQLAQTSAQRAEDYLLRLGYSAELAAAYGRAVSSTAFPTTFRVKSWSLDWSSEDGITVSGDLINYVEVRADVPAPDGEEPDASPGAAQPVQVVVE